MNEKEKTERQTRACDKLREYLQSIAILAVQAQDDGSTDSVCDTLDLIEHDLMNARKQLNILQDWNGAK